MEIKSRELSRREKRKEARLAKKKNRLSSWMQHQEISKLKRSSLNSNPKGEVQSMVVDVEKGVMEEQPSNAKEYEEKLDSLKDLVPTSTTMKNGNKSLKRKSKTKFEEFLEMDMKKDVISAEEDLRLERKLAKKLKVKSGKLRGIDDEVDMLFDGIPSILDSSMDEEPPDVGDDDKRSKHNSSSKKNKKRKLLVISEGAQEDDPTSDTTFRGPEPTTSGTTKVAIEEPSVKVLLVDGNAKYIAPHLRSRAGNESEEYTQLRRRVRGLLNRLSESNVESITQEMSTIFSSVGRSFGSQMISEEVLASCSGGPRGNEQYASVFAAFVAGMACLVGVDFGAKLIASLAKCFEEEYLKEDNLSLRNLTLLLSYLYIFGVCSSELIYDFLIILSKRLMEIDVSTILTILKCCGMKLRGDDPTAMKDFIFSVQNRVNELKSPSGSKPDDQPKINNKRMEFMLETICDIKNNKRWSKEDSAQHTRIKKWLQKLRVEDILLRGLKWSKLLDPHKKGQWWLSGDIASTVDNVEELANRIEKDVSEAHEMLQLAAAQGMNTDTRRAIYCVIMRAEDCVDGFRNLIKLNLHGKQDRDIMRVLLECCLQEIIFNRYYTILASKLCEHNKNNKFTLQYCLWDYFKEINSIETKKSMHLARFIAEMFASFTLSLAVLKVVDLCDTTKLNARGMLHFKLIFEAIFKFSDDIVWNIFSRVAVITDLKTLRNGMKYFIKKYVVKRDVTFPDKFKIAAEAMENLTGVLR